MPPEIFVRITENSTRTRAHNARTRAREIHVGFWVRPGQALVGHAQASAASDRGSATAARDRENFLRGRRPKNTLELCNVERPWQSSKPSESPRGHPRMAVISSARRLQALHGFAL